MGYRTNDKGQEIPKCDGNRECLDRVTWIDDKGFAYCAKHGIEQNDPNWHRARKMAAWERKLIEAGKPIPGYSRRKKPAEVQP